MIHVAIDGTTWDNERGFGRFTRSLVTALAERRGEFRYTLLVQRPPERELPENVKLVVADENVAETGAAVRGAGQFTSLMRAASRIDFDLFYYPAVYSYFPLLTRRPVITCFHDTIPERFPDLIFPSKTQFRFWQAKCAIANWASRRIMTVSEASARDLSEILGIRRSRIDTVTEGVSEIFAPIRDSERLAARRAAHDIPADAPLLVYVGGFNRHKNVARLIEAMKLIGPRVPEARLVLVGKTSGVRFWDNIDELQDASGETGNILFTGEIDDTALAELLNTATALAMPSLWEGFGLPALEAMSCGTPVLSSDRGSLPEVVGDGGLYFDPEVTGDIADKAVELLRDGELQTRLRERALNRADRFGWDKAAELAEVSFRNALGR